MSILARRKRIDLIWLTGGVALLVWLVVCLLRGETYIPSKRGPGHLYQLAVNPSQYWFAIKFQAGFTVLTLLASMLHFPALAVWNARALRRMGRERRHPIKRSLLWKLVAYVALPLAVYIGLIALLV